MHLLGKCYAIFILLNTIYIATSIDPVVRITETSPDSIGSVIIAERDKDVTLSCFVENLQANTYVKWQRTVRNRVNGLIQTEPLSDDQALEDNISFGIEKPTLFTWRLRIRTVDVIDEGNYTCYVEVARQIKAFSNRTLIVYVKPTLDPGHTSADFTVNEDEAVDLNCNATGRPTPHVQWERQGKALLPVGMEKYMGGHMHINEIQAHHRGLYKCIASNAIGTTTREIFVGVRFKPIITVIQADLRQTEGCRIELQCLVEAYPEPHYTELAWFHGNTRITQSGDRYTVQVLRGAFNRMTYELIIDDVTSNDYGDYRCQATNTLGVTSANVILRRSDQPENSIKFGRPICGCAALTSCLPILILATITSLLLKYRP